MAFRVIKKKKRQAAPSASDILDLDAGTDNENVVNEDLEEDETSDSPSPITPSYMKPQKKNVVATQAWVFRMMKSIWNWTRHFGTQSLAVAGPINSALLTTGEV